MSKHLMVKYKVREEHLEEVLQAIQEFVDAISRTELGVITYEAFQLKDKVSFMHIMAFKDEEAEASHRGAPHTKGFAGILYPLCDVQPEFTDLSIVRAK